MRPLNPAMFGIAPLKMAPRAAAPVLQPVSAPCTPPAFLALRVCGRGDARQREQRGDDEGENGRPCVGHVRQKHVRGAMVAPLR